MLTRTALRTRLTAQRGRLSGGVGFQTSRAASVALKNSRTTFLSSINSTQTYSTTAHNTILERNKRLQNETDAAIVHLASLPQKNISLDELVKFPRDLDTDARNEILIANAQDTLEQIKIGLAHRLNALRNLQYLVVLNPHIAQIYQLYYCSFLIISSFKPPQTVEENLQFVERLKDLVETHSNTIPVLSRGFSECQSLMPLSQINTLLNSHLNARMGTRLLAEHHIALTNPIADNFIGAVQLDFSPGKMLHECSQFAGEICNLYYGVRPEVQIDVGEDVTLPFVPDHVQYIFQELLKNSFRAHAEAKNGGDPIIATISKTEDGVMIRLRDIGGGIKPENENKIFEFSFTTFQDEGQGDGFSTLNNFQGGSSIAGMGYGLPLSRAYAEFFGGDLKLQSYFGLGTDVYISLKAPKL
ncbi:[3-methyl-2-oxobutanoate dehydrogenase [lipoamide]] kinase [Yarrowia sp. B02]|nr:[3-methyl-2-oxobutanoate dehydrogenase [lipoamide]] kinase [Yarrowia sp. B02]